MVDKKEVFIVVAVIFILALSINLSISLTSGFNTLLITLLSVAIIVISNVLIKKLVAYNLDSEIEMKVWEIGVRIHEFWKPLFSKERHSRKLLPLGAILPVLSKLLFLSFNNFVWMASLVFDVKPRIYRSAKRFGLYTFSDVTEYHLGLIAASGIVINLVLALVGYLLGFPLFARLNIYYAFFNILPLSELDGNKILFGSKVIWSFLASIVLIGMLFAILIV